MTYTTYITQQLDRENFDELIVRRLRVRNSESLNHQHDSESFRILA